MSQSINKAVLLGNLGKEPEIKTVEKNGVTSEFAIFSVATTESWNDKVTGEKQEKTEWHNVVAYQPVLVNVVKNYLTKGSKVYLEGKIRSRKWIDNNNVEKIAKDIVLEGYDAKIVLCGNKNTNMNDSSNGSYNVSTSSEKVSNSASITTEDDDELPF